MLDTEIHSRDTSAMPVRTRVLERASSMGMLVAPMNGSGPVERDNDNRGEECEESIGQHGKECGCSVSKRRASTGRGRVVGERGTKTKE